MAHVTRGGRGRYGRLTNDPGCQSALPVMDEHYLETHGVNNPVLKRARSFENLAQLVEGKPRARFRRAAKEKIKSYDDKFGIFRATFKVVRDPEEELAPKFCYCRNPDKDFDSMLVECSNGICRYEWFHFSCVGLKSAPHGTWYCPGCRETSKDSKKALPMKELQRKLKEYYEATERESDSD